MTFSRSHAGMIGIISLFTGMIAPVLGNGTDGYPFPLTDLQTLVYILFFLLSFGFYVVSIQNWKLFRYTSVIIGLCLVYIFILSFRGSVHTLTDGTGLDTLLWGWGFIIIGVIALTYTCIYDTPPIDTSDESILSDTIIGIVGTFTLLGLTALIIAASIDTQNQGHSQAILVESLGSDSIVYTSGVTMSKAYTNIGDLVFDRKNDTISYTVYTASGIILYPSGNTYTGTDFSVNKLGQKYIIKSKESTWIDNMPLDGETYVEGYTGAMVIEYPDKVDVLTATKKKTYTGTSIYQKSLRVSEDTEMLSWITKTLSGYVIQKEGKNISDPYYEILELAISKNGDDTMSLIRTKNNETLVLKNGIPIETIRKEFVENSWKSNGSHNIYITNNNGVKRIIYDGVSVGKEFHEVREIFLEKNGNAYAFFAQPIGGSTYCLYTRYRGTLCELTGYMNPRLGADGSSIIYAGLKDGSWGIYRNIDQIIRDTGYTNTDISGDYVFFDITNPKQYLFIERRDTGEYQLRKNGKLLPGIWKDVGLDVTFGYDNKVIMTAKDTSGWRVIEF